MSRVVHFEIQADDLERAKAFYGAVFGWDFQDWSSAAGGSPYWGIVTGPADQPGINGGLLQRPAPSPGPGQGTNAYVCTMGVEDYDATEKKILDAGPPATGAHPCVGFLTYDEVVAHLRPLGVWSVRGDENGWQACP